MIEPRSTAIRRLAGVTLLSLAGLPAVLGVFVPFKSLPVVVLTHDPKRWNAPANFAQAQPVWDQMQMEIVHLSPNSSLIVAAGSDHDIHVERLELVIQAVRRVYDSAVQNRTIEQHGVSASSLEHLWNR